MYIAPIKQYKRRAFEPAEIRRIRTIFKMTAKELGDVLWVSSETVKSWESGRRNPDGPARRLMCELSEAADEKEREENLAIGRVLFKSKNREKNEKENLNK